MNDTGEAAPLSAGSPLNSRVSLLWLLGVAVYLIALWYFGWEKVASSVAQVRPSYLIAAVVVELAALWLRVVKWRYALGPNSSALFMFFLSKATGSWTPGRLGELSPLLLPRYRSPRFGAWIVVDRLLEGSATLVVGFLGAALLSLSSTAASPYRLELLAIICVAFVVLAIAPAYLLTRENWFEAAAARFRSGSVAHRLLTWFQRVSAEALLLKGKLPLAATLTIVTTCLDVLLGMLFWRAFSATLSFPLLATVQCVFGIISAVPITPTASGAPYLAAGVMLYEAAHLPPEVYTGGVALHLLIQSALFWSSFGVARTLAGKHA